MSQRQLATDITDFSSGALGLVEYAASLLNDRDLRYWSKPELIVYINEAQDEIATEINTVYREFFLTSATTPTVADQSLYSLPTDLVELMGIEVVDSVTTDKEPQDLVEVFLKDKKFYEKLDDANDKTKFQFFFIQGCNFRLVPGAANASQFIRTFYVKRLTPMVNNADVSEIPAQHHELLSVRGAQRALIKPDTTNVNLDKLDAKLSAKLLLDVARFSRLREEIREPWSGTFGLEYTWLGGQTAE
jgi:hypothetical protein